MLRSLLGEPPRRDEGLLSDTFKTMRQVIQHFQARPDRSSGSKLDYSKLQIWIEGLAASLDELEQCTHASAFFRHKVHTRYIAEMGPQEKGDYARYVYFYKDGFIRVFSILDKLGTVLNELYGLNTARVKPHYSYFTVLRQFSYLGVHPRLGQRLTEIKEQHKDSLSRLRRRRNTEIHYMNSEMQDDLWQKNQAPHGKLELEDMDQHLTDLMDGYQMVLESLNVSFKYTLSNIKVF
ncbi:Cthe_2314 family HEPN domain-containing protein [Paenibacillus tuaregi]|uniref:Cthe_2314 family HEPN domain-containing protein n=1 Tax=Paenibacillus tuaregi TaxID=1816681 RepID=UPI0008395C88|nr:Cthe_2314 family HEPN domain-containing protein [Paenibacillus tuaregi]